MLPLPRVALLGRRFKLGLDRAGKNCCNNTICGGLDMPAAKEGIRMPRGRKINPAAL